MDDLAIFRPFQQYFSHIKAMGGGQWKALCIGTPFTIENISTRAGLEIGTARSVGQRLTLWATGAPKVYRIYQAIRRAFCASRMTSNN